MANTRDDYILKSLSKISHKSWELFVISRIIHGLNDREIEFVCQQAIHGKEDSWPYLVDLFFPQFGLYLEIDEPADYKYTAANIERSRDIVNATNFDEERIIIQPDKKKPPLSMEEVCCEADRFVNLVQSKKEAAVRNKTFTPWDFETRYSAEPHFARGYISLKSNAVFRTHRDALSCFGYAKGHYQRGFWRLPATKVQELGKTGDWAVWFPKLYATKGWENSLSDDGQTIYEKQTDGTYIDNVGPDHRIVFAHYKDNLGFTLYRFLGVFTPDRTSSEPGLHIFKLESECMNLK